MAKKRIEIVECMCHDPINKVGVHYHIIQEEKS